MAKAKAGATGSVHRPSSKRKRPGVHAKSKSSRSKAAKNYLKRPVGQG